MTVAAPDSTSQRSVEERRRRVGRALDRARDNLGALSRFATVVDGVPWIVAEPPLVVPVDMLYPDRVKREGLEEAGPAVLEPFLGPAAQDTAGARVVVGQRLMQTAGDIFLGWQRVTGVDGADRDFYLRQLRDWKASVELDEVSPSGPVVHAEICGWMLACAHARSGNGMAITAYLGASVRFDRAVTRFAELYAERTEQDHAALLAAAADGGVIAAAQD